jgi:hypothetical protein
VLLEGGDPYTAIGPGRRFPFEWPFYYPLPAAVSGMPFVGMSLVHARIAFAATLGFVCALAVGSSRLPYRYTVLLSGAFLQGIQHLQLAPLLLAAVLWPALGWLTALKPNIGIATLAGARDWRAVRVAVIGGAVVSLVFLAVDPVWPLKWLTLARSASQTVPMITRGHGLGFVLLLAALRWRDPQARTLLALTAIPATAGAMEPLLLFAFPMTFRRQLVLALLTHFPPMVVHWWIGQHGGEFASVPYLNAQAVALLWLVYLPALVMVLTAPRPVRATSSAAMPVQARDAA